uniref:Chemokine interleukin-8-like domain-containing protein n=1 Tax=Sphaeramia orbicularis TaxID=375764 RepID=A0A672Z4M2_9TELE
MSGSAKSCILLWVSVAVLCIQLHLAHDIHIRCLCHETVKFIKGNMSDFQVLERRSGCDKTELIVTMSRQNNSTDKVCMNTEGKMAKAFLRCWESLNLRNKISLKKSRYLCL